MKTTFVCGQTAGGANVLINLQHILSIHDIQGHAEIELVNSDRIILEKTFEQFEEVLNNPKTEENIGYYTVVDLSYEEAQNENGF